MPAEDESYGCAADVGINMVSGKWKPRILFELSKQTRRFGELRRLVPKVSRHVLTVQLRELETDGLLQRTVFPSVPPRVEYALTEYGSRMMPVLEQMVVIGEQHISRHKAEKQERTGEE